MLGVVLLLLQYLVHILDAFFNLLVKLDLSLLLDMLLFEVVSFGYSIDIGLLLADHLMHHLLTKLILHIVIDLVHHLILFVFNLALFVILNLLNYLFDQIFSEQS